MQNSKTSNHQLLKKITCWMLVTMGIFIFSILLVILLFALNRDRISSYILHSANNLTQGEVSFDKVSLSPILQFPKLSLTINNFTLHEKKVPYRDSLSIPIARIERVSVGVNILELTRGKITIQSILLENGTLEIKKHSDSSLNIMNAIKLKAIDRIDNSKINTKDTLLQNDSLVERKFNFLLEKVELNNLVFNIDNQTNKNFSSLIVNNLESKLSFDKDSTQFWVNTQLKVMKITMAPFNNASNLDVSIQTSLSYHAKTKQLFINPSSLSIMEAMFSAHGSVDLGPNKYVDVELDGSDADMSLLKLIIKKEAHSTIKSGKVDFNAKIKGTFNSGIPQITCNFGIHKLNLVNPKNPFSIRNLSLNGTFNSGAKGNLTDAKIKIDTINATLPDGYIRGRFLLTNLKSPELDYVIDLKTNLDGIASIIKAKKLAHLEGKISLFSDFKGRFINNNTSYEAFHSNAIIHFDSVSCTITDRLNIRALNGSISGNIDTLCLDNLSAQMGNSDIRLDGMAYNASNLFLRSQNNVVANLHVSSRLFDLADFIRSKPSVGRGFPYQIHHLTSDVIFTTNRELLFSKSPGAHFTITNQETNVTIDKLLPRVKILDGVFEMGDKDGDRILRFNDFDISFYGGRVKADVIYHTPFDADRYVDIHTQLTDFNAGKLLYYKQDSIPKIADAPLNGDLHCNLSFTTDTMLMFREVLLEASKLKYRNDSTEFKIGKMRLNANNTNYKSKPNNFLATLSTTLDLNMVDFNSKKLNIDEANFNFVFSEDSTIIVDDLTANIRNFTYKTDSAINNIGTLKLNAQNTTFNTSIVKNPLATLSTQVNISADQIKSPSIETDKLIYEIKATNGAYQITSFNASILGVGGFGNIYIVPFKKPIEFKVSYELNRFDASRIVKLAKKGDFLTGKLNLKVDINGSINNSDSLLKQINGSVELTGTDLILKGINIDEFLKDAEKSQNYDLVDLGAFMVAGPAGLLVSRGTSMTKVLLTDKNATTKITQFKSGFSFKSGLFSINDMAFTTDINRLAAKGWLDLNSKSLKAEIAVVNAKGCTKMSQVISGPINKPKLSELKVFSSLFAPATNLYDDVAKSDCEPFYTGSVKHPVNVEKKKP